MSVPRPSCCPICSASDAVDLEGQYLHCRCCGGYSLFPAPSNEQVRQVGQAYQTRLHEIDDPFDWRLFFLDLYLSGEGTMTYLGAADPRFEGAAASRGYQVRRHGGDAAKPPRSPVVAAWDLLEFDPYPMATLRRAKDLLAPGGKLLIRVRDRGALAHREAVPLRRNWGQLHYFEQQTLTLLMTEVFGQRPLFVQSQDEQGEFLVCVVDLEHPMTDPERQVLLVAHADAFGDIDDAPGPRLRIAKTLLGLRRASWAADLAVAIQPHCEGYDLVHLYHHAWRSMDSLSQAQPVLYAGVPLVISTIYMELSESNFAVRAIPRIFQAWPEAEREQMLSSLERGELRIEGSDIPGRLPVIQPLVDAQKALFSLADHMIALSLTEVRTIGQHLGLHKPFTIVPNCADTTLFRQGNRERFVERYGVEDFVISVGHLEPRKNQLMLLYALRESGIPVVIVGASNEYTQDYADLCRYYAPPATRLISQLPQYELADAFAAARVHALPSWNEGASLASIEAAMSGCAIVVGNRAGEWEYYRGDAYYCNPASLTSIRGAVLRAYREHDREKSQRMAARFTEEHSFAAHVGATIDAYETALARYGVDREAATTGGR